MGYDQLINKAVKILQVETEVDSNKGYCAPHIKIIEAAISLLQEAVNNLKEESASF